MTLRPLLLPAALALLAATVSMNSGATAPTTGNPTADESLAQLLRGHGIRPVQPPTPATDFRLPDLAGGERALSDSRGEWVVVTFFATWCGPCRSEMPTLEALHGKLGNQGLAVLGVSVDRDDAKLPAFLEGLGVTFPNLWDRTSSVARTYRASSIPLSYVIDPMGRIVGISRGARDWGALAGLMEASFEIYPPTPGQRPNREQAQYVASQDLENAAPVELPSQLEPPTAELALSDDSPRPGESFHLEVKIHWAGNFDEYLLLPPALQAPEGLRQLGTSALTSSVAGRNVVTYRLEFESAEPGSFALDPIELRYTPRFEQEPVASRLAGPTVTVATPTWLGMNRTVAVASAVSGTTALALLAGLWIRRRGAAAPTRDLATERFQRLQGLFDEARAQRMRGEAGTCLASLAKIEDELGSAPSDEERAQVARWIEDARYGGRPPAREQLDRIERRVERALETIRPDSRRSERARVSRRLRAKAAATATEEFPPLAPEGPKTEDR